MKRLGTGNGLESLHLKVVVGLCQESKRKSYIPPPGSEYDNRTTHLLVRLFVHLILGFVVWA